MTQSPVPAPDAAETQLKLAILWEARGQPARAIAGYEAALRLRPDYAAAYLALGALLERVGRVADAAAVYRRATEALPGAAMFRRRLNAPLRDMDTPANPAAENEASIGGRGHILLYTDGASVYGLGQFNHALALGLRAAGYRVTCAQPPTAHSLIDERRAAGIGHAWLDPDDLYDRRVTPRALTDAEEPHRLLAALRPDLVIFSGGAPMSSLAGREAAAARGVPYLVIVHCVTSAWAQPFASYRDRVAASFAAALDVVAVSEENLTRLRREFGLADNRGRVILNGRPARYFAAPESGRRAALRETLGLAAEDVAVCTVASLEMRKGYQHLLKAAARLPARDGRPRLSFVWVGAGSLQGRLRALADDLGVADRVRFLGERDDVPDILAASDIFALASHYEGMPLSIMEAMAAGLPVVATAVSGIPDELGDTGALLPDPNDDPAATVDALVATLAAWADDADRRRAVGAACRARAATLFREERMVGEYIALVAHLNTTRNPGS